MTGSPDDQATLEIFWRHAPSLPERFAVDLDFAARIGASELKGSSTVNNIEDGML
ncbi:MAG TPA: hypothetical protein VFG23_12405 [Polyangia bacterium]|nr:hypothetical protein [Polyangia bacterium]